MLDLLERLNDPLAANTYGEARKLLDEARAEIAQLTAALEIAQGQVEHAAAYLALEIKERGRLTTERDSAVAEAARLQSYNAGLAKIGADLEAERDALRVQLGIVISALRYHEGATGEMFDDEGGDIAGIEAELKAHEQIAPSPSPPAVSGG